MRPLYSHFYLKHYTFTYYITKNPGPQLNLKHETALKQPVELLRVFVSFSATWGDMYSVLHSPMGDWCLL